MLEVGATFRTFQSVLQNAFEKRRNGNSWYFFDLTVAAASEFDLPSAIHYYTDVVYVGLVDLINPGTDFSMHRKF